MATRLFFAMAVLWAATTPAIARPTALAEAKSDLPKRTRASLDFQWKFLKGDVANAERIDFDDRNWQDVNLPHDWTIEGPVEKSNDRNNGFYPAGIGWYRRHLTLDVSCAGCQIYLEFEGIYRNSTLWVNGQKVGSHLSGYTGVVYDITPYVHRDGKPNSLAVRVDGRQKEGWWYEGCGIYRHVWLVTTDKVHVANWGTFITTPHVSEAEATVRARTTVQNDSPSLQPCVVETQILDAQQRTVATLKSEGTITAKSPLDFSQQVLLARPHLWSPETPYLYRAKTVVFVSGQCVDAYETPFGVRCFEFTPDKGLFLNGRHIQLRGMCNHHDFGGLGVALPDRANEKTVEVMKRMGCNLLRSAHNDAAPSLIEACDRLGLLVWAETRDLGPAEQAVPPLRDLIRRNRNHPSIFCWSLANTAGSHDGIYTKYLKILNDVAHDEDPSRPTAFACEGNDDANANGFALVTDLMGYNGGGMGIDDRDHKLYPNRKMLISEFSSGRGSRGVYEEKIIGPVFTETLGDGRTVKRAGQYCSTYDLCRAHETEWAHVAKRPWLAGGAMWSGIDYGGENTGWPVVTSQFGVLDRCRFPNDAYYYYLQEWTSKPMVHIFPHWTWPGKKSKPIRVWVYSNCDTVELLLNGKSLGVKPRQPLEHLEWYVPYQRGTLSARASKDGCVVCVQKITTAGAPSRIKLTADHQTIMADGRDLSFITIQIEDRDGNSVPTADNDIVVEVQGHGRLLGLCSGDPGSHENPKAGHMRAFNSLLLAVVQSNGSPGRSTVTASSPDIRAGALELETR
jgi:beta-galactosidase